MSDKKEYYTAGELAKLFGIPKQTMFYYDKMGLLTPEFVAKNGYRYYAMPQYLTLEIILFLRKLDISVPHIKEFLEHRSRDKILGILKERESLCKQTLSETQQLLAAISCYRKTLESKSAHGTQSSAPAMLSGQSYVSDADPRSAPRRVRCHRDTRPACA